MLWQPQEHMTCCLDVACYQHSSATRAWCTLYQSTPLSWESQASQPGGKGTRQLTSKPEWWVRHPWPTLQAGLCSKLVNLSQQISVVSKAAQGIKPLHICMHI